MSARGGRLLLYALPYTLITSLSYGFAKDGLRYVDPVTFMAIRYLVALLGTFLLARGVRFQFNKDNILLGLFTFISTLLWIVGLQFVSPAESSVFSYTMPLFAIPLSILMLKEKVPRLGWLGTTVGFAGVVVYSLAVAGGGGSSLPGAILTLANAVFWAFYTIYYRKTRNQDALGTVQTQFLITAGLFWLLTPLGFRLVITPESLVDVGYVSLLNGLVAMLLWNVMLRREKVGKIVTLAYAVPATTTIIEAVETGVPPSFVIICGMCLMFLGIFVSRFHQIASSDGIKGSEDEERAPATSGEPSRQPKFDG